MTEFLKPNEYINYLQMNARDKHLLVEGDSDIAYFELLFEEFLGDDWKDLHRIIIDDAGKLISSDGQKKGNREKIEEICDSCLEDNLTGFVDREFRRFTINENCVIDELDSHFTSQKLIWSRGHSIENYYFQLNIIKKAFRDIYTGDFRNAFRVFQHNFDTYIRNASALTLLALKKNYELHNFRGTINWRIILHDGNIDLPFWKSELGSHNLPNDEVENIIQLFPNIITCVSQSDLSTIRWLCHGHIGSTFLWHAFARCIYDTKDGMDNEKTSAVQNFLNHQRNIKFCGRSWANEAHNNNAEYPSMIFTYFGINI